MKSYSKIRHIQESNLRLEKRYLNEEDDGINYDEITTMVEKALIPKNFKKNGSKLSKDLYEMNVGGKGKKFATLSFYIRRGDADMVFEFNKNGKEDLVLVDLLPAGKDFTSLFEEFGRLSESQNVEQLNMLHDMFFKTAEKYNQNILYK